MRLYRTGGGDGGRRRVNGDSLTTTRAGKAPFPLHWAFAGKIEIDPQSTLPFQSNCEPREPRVPLPGTCPFCPQQPPGPRWPPRLFHIRNSSRMYVPYNTAEHAVVVEALVLWCTSRQHARGENEPARSQRWTDRGCKLGAVGVRRAIHLWQ